MEFLKAYKSYPYVFIKFEEGNKSYLVFNSSEKKLSQKEINGFKIEIFEGDESKLINLVGKENIEIISKEDSFIYQSGNFSNARNYEETGKFFLLYVSYKK
ncbi:MAG: hypothetical protein QXW97_02350 [Candidatus Pacearchaeota archaeon]